MSDETGNVGHKWDSDRAGWLPEHDELSRRFFAEKVAKELRSWKQKDSLVVSLNGDWGSGKTTLVNLIKHYAAKQPEGASEEKPIFVFFNPWQWSGQDLLMQAFFDEIGAAFRGDSIRNKDLAERLAKFWEGLKLTTVAGGELATRLQESLTALTALLAGASGVLAGRLPEGKIQSVLSWVGIGLLGVSALCAIYAPIAEVLASLFKWRAEKPKPSLEEVRNQLKTELKKLPAPIIVVIDDIDRLNKEEVRMIVQLVKANADFPNLVYVLLFQRSIVVHALDEISCEGGQEFLKKIVQVELEIPAAPEHELKAFFVKQLDPVITRAKIRWDKDTQERWARLFDDAIWPWFRTPRDIKRFKGMLEFYLEAHIEDGVLEVNPIDLILVEILRTFDPTAFEAVSRAFQKQRNLLVAVLFGNEEAKERFVLGAKAIVEREGLSEEERTRLRRVLAALFPQSQEGFSMSSTQDLEWDRDLRICHHKHFARYFQLGGNPGDVGAAFVNRLVNAAGDVGKLQEQLRATLTPESFEPLLERLKAVREDLPKSMIEPLIKALFNLSDALPTFRSNSFISSGPERDLTRVVTALLLQLPDRADRSAVLQRCVTESTAITGPTMCVSFLGPRKDESGAKHEEHIDVATLKTLQQQLLPRIWETLKSGRVWKLRASAYLIYRTLEWDGNAVCEWLKTAIKDPETALAFLMSMLQESQVSGGNGTRAVYSVRGNELEKFVDLESLASAASRASADDLGKAAVKGLQLAVQRKGENKPYGEIYVMSRGLDGKLFHDQHDSFL